MRLAIASAIFILGFSVPVFAQDERPPLLEAALTHTDTTQSSQDEWRFNLTILTSDGPVIGHFDGSKPVEEQWELITPAFEELEDQRLEWWENIIGEDSSEDDSGLFIGTDIREMIGGNVVELSSTDTHVTYGFTPNMDEDGDIDMGQYVDGFVTVLKEGAFITRLRINAPESFKPLPIVRMTHMELSFDFGSLEGVDYPVLTTMHTHMAGSALFQSFDDEVIFQYSDIEFIH